MADTDIDMVWEALGDDAFERLRKLYGGKLVYIPTSRALHPLHWLVKEFGSALATRLCQAMAVDGLGVQIAVPFYRQTRLETEREVLRLAKVGKSANEIAANLGISRRYVFTVKRRLKKQGRL